MRVRVISDLHLESHSYVEVDRFLPFHPEDRHSVLIIAGDLGVAKRPDTYVDFLNQMYGRFKRVLYIPGNHEHYFSNIDQTVTEMKTRYRLKYSCNDVDYPHYEFGSRYTYQIDDVLFICATLWSNMENGNPNAMAEISECINDFSHIQKHDEYGNTKMFAPKDAIEIYNQDVDFIQQHIRYAKGKQLKTIVVTHHAPSFESVDMQWAGSIYNGAFASDMYTGWDQGDIPDLHIHGHMHNSSVYQSRFGTFIVCNPVGYSNEINEKYDPNFAINTNDIQSLSTYWEDLTATHRREIELALQKQQEAEDMARLEQMEAEAQRRRDAERSIDQVISEYTAVSNFDWSQPIEDENNK